MFPMSYVPARTPLAFPHSFGLCPAYHVIGISHDKPRNRVPQLSSVGYFRVVLQMFAFIMVRHRAR